MWTARGVLKNHTAGKKYHQPPKACSPSKNVRLYPTVLANPRTSTSQVSGIRRWVWSQSATQLRAAPSVFVADQASGDIGEPKEKRNPYTAHTVAHATPPAPPSASASRSHKPGAICDLNAASRTANSTAKMGAIRRPLSLVASNAPMAMPARRTFKIVTPCKRRHEAHVAATNARVTAMSVVANALLETTTGCRQNNARVSRPAASPCNRRAQAKSTTPSAIPIVMAARRPRWRRAVPSLRSSARKSRPRSLSATTIGAGSFAMISGRWGLRGRRGAASQSWARRRLFVVISGAPGVR